MSEVIWTEVLDRDFEMMDHGSINDLSGKTVFVTGATGLVGSIFIKYLVYANCKLNANIKIIGLVRNLDKAKGIFGPYFNQIKFVVSDLAEDDIEVIDNIDFILHAAAVTKSKLMVTYPVDLIKTSIYGTQKILDLANEKNAKLVYLSSMEVYGNVASSTKASENVLGYINLSNVRSCYPESKRMCEALCNAYHAQYGTEVIIVRLAATFGAGILQGENRAFAQFVNSAINGNNIILRTLGNSEGNYVYSTDAIQAILLLMSKGKSCEAYNVANEESHMTIKEFASIIVDTLGEGNVSLEFDVDEDNVLGYAEDVKLFLDASKIKKLGWKPSVSQSEAVVRLADYMRENF